MTSNRARSAHRRATVAFWVALVLAGCALEPKPPPPQPEPAPPSLPVEAPAQPALSPQEAKAEAQKLAMRALDGLQNGEEEAARALLEQALKLDASNDLANRLRPQITRDARQELGAQSFPYTVQRGDSLATLAQRFLGDRYRFYSLAKYNDIKVPNRLAAGQTLRIPGKQPPTPPSKPAPAKSEPTKPEPVAVEPVKPEPAPLPPPKPKVDEAREAADRLIAEGRLHEKQGDLRGAMRAYDAARTRDPGYAEAARLYQVTRKRVIDSLDREATSMFSKQDLKGAIAKWDELLELDPGNKLATLKRAQAVDLQKKADEFGKK